MSLTLGARLGPYEVTALIGQGGMGEVYRARDTKLDRDVALKVLSRRRHKSRLAVWRLSKRPSCRYALAARWRVGGSQSLLYRDGGPLGLVRARAVLLRR